MSKIRFCKETKTAVYDGEVFIAAAGMDGCDGCNLCSVCGSDTPTIRACKDAIGPKYILINASKIKSTSSQTLSVLGDIKIAALEGKINALKERVTELEAKAKYEPTEEEPLPCPFCGCSPTVSQVWGEWQVQCAEDKADCPVVARTTTFTFKEDAIEAWNHRR